MLKVKVNGVATQLSAGRVLPALRAAGFKVPSVCYHADIDHSGGRCRVCVCKINGGFAMPCTLDVKEGMDIITESKELQQLRTAALALVPHIHGAGGPAEFTEELEKLTGIELAKHPNVASGMGAETLPIKGKRYIIRRPELCTHCGLCVQMCQSMQGVGAIADMRTTEEHHGGVATFHGCNMPASECVTCGQCINVCPTGALEEATDLEQVNEILKNDKRVKVVQFAPAVRIALAEEFGCAPGERSLTHEMVAALRKLSKNTFVFDTNFTADLTIIEEGNELLERLRRNLTGKAKLGPEHMETALPMITSCSPGWIQYAEKNYHDLLPNLSSCKSPQQMHGALTKHYWAKKQGLAAKDVTTISVMPCVAKKFEKDRPELGQDGVQDVDHVLTTREFAKLLKMNKIDPTKVEPEEFDKPFGIGSGAGLIFGATGGVMEAALRTAYEVITGREVPFQHLEVVPVRGMEGVKEAAVPLKDVLPEWSFLEGVEVKIAVAHGIANAHKLMDRIRERKAQNLPPEYHFVEIMACPGGCIGGGGQPKPTSFEVKRQRAKLIYNEDQQLPLRKSHENPAVAELYKDFLKEPLGHHSHHLLHTHYVPRIPDVAPLLSSGEARTIQAEVLSKFPRVRSRLTNIFSEIVDKYGYISDAAVIAIADHVRTTPADIDSVLSHYHFFPRHAVPKSMVYMCDCTSCRMHGADKVIAYLKESNIPFHTAPWLGWCVNGAPAAMIKHTGDPQVHAMLNVKPNDPRLSNLSAFKNPFPELSYKVLGSERLGAETPSTLSIIPLTPEDAQYFKKTMQCPVSKKAYSMKPEEIIEQIKLSGLRGCGGAGFPTHFKWASVRAQPADAGGKYIVINADEGLPNTFKDYHLLQDQRCRMRMMSGVGIASYVTGANNCVLYLRYEYKNLKPMLEESFGQYRKMNPKLGKDFRFEVVLGGGPYVCGEETALFESVEGQLPQARSERGLFPTQRGVFGRPTLVGNVETFSWIPIIVYKGASAMPQTSADQRGLKLLSISGDIPKPVLAEYPMGVTLRKVLEECAGIPVSEIAAVEVGGMLEELVFPAEFDKILSLDNKPDHLSAGGSIVIFGKDKLNEQELFEAKAKFCSVESCQLCTPCRVGTQVMRAAMPSLFSGTLFDTQANAQLLRLKEMVSAMEVSSNCGHGKACGKANRLLIERLAKKHVKKGFFRSIFGAVF